MRFIILLFVVTAIAFVACENSSKLSNEEPVSFTGGAIRSQRHEKTRNLDPNSKINGGKDEENHESEHFRPKRWGGWGGRGYGGWGRGYGGWGRGYGGWGRGYGGWGRGYGGWGRGYGGWGRGYGGYGWGR